MQSTYIAKTGEVERQWFVVDAQDQILGRLAVRLARILMGKTKPVYTPHVDTGDFVIVVNAEKITVTGKKAEQKTYQHYTGYPSGLKETKFYKMLERKPEDIIRLAVRRMLPKNKLGRKMLKKLKVYRGPAHPHQAQKPEPLTLQ